MTETDKTEPTDTEAALHVKDKWCAHWKAAKQAVFASMDEALHAGFCALDLDITQDGVLTHCGEIPLTGSVLLHITCKTQGPPQLEPIMFTLCPQKPGIIATCIGGTFYPESHKPEDYHRTPWDVCVGWVLRVAE